MVVDWLDFYESSVKSGWNIKTTLNKIEYALIDIKGKEYSTQVITRLKYYIGNKNATNKS